MTEKLHNELDTNEIKQTRFKLPFKDRSIGEFKKTDITFGKSRFKWFKFNVPKGCILSTSPSPRD